MKTDIIISHTQTDYYSMLVDAYPRRFYKTLYCKSYWRGCFFNCCYGFIVCSISQVAPINLIKRGQQTYQSGICMINIAKYRTMYSGIGVVYDLCYSMETVTLHYDDNVSKRILHLVITRLPQVFGLLSLEAQTFQRDYFPRHV